MTLVMSIGGGGGMQYDTMHLGLLGGLRTSSSTGRLEIDLHMLVRRSVNEGHVLIVAANRWESALALARFVRTDHHEL